MPLCAGIVARNVACRRFRLVLASPRPLRPPNVAVRQLPSAADLSDAGVDSHESFRSTLEALRSPVRTTVPALVETVMLSPASCIRCRRRQLPSLRNEEVVPVIGDIVRFNPAMR